MAKKVLVIDDEFWKIKDLFHVIQAKGHSLEGIDNIDGALEKLKKTQYDLIILDIIFPVSKDRHFDETDTDMGRRTGIEMLREIKSKYGPVLVIILSARRPGIFEDLSKGLGAEKYLPKPISPRDLWDNIKEYLED